MPDRIGAFKQLQTQIPLLQSLRHIQLEEVCAREPLILFFFSSLNNATGRYKDGEEIC